MLDSLIRPLLFRYILEHGHRSGNVSLLVFKGAGVPCRGLMNPVIPDVFNLEIPDLYALPGSHLYRHLLWGQLFAFMVYPEWRAISAGLGQAFPGPYS